MCTGLRFTDSQGNMFFGRNLDWSCGYGQRIVVVPKGFEYKSAFLGEMSPKWNVIGMGIIEENTPLYFDCANEAGLGIAGLNFPGYAEYAADKVDGKNNVAAYEFPFWVAMNFSSVDEVEEALKNVVIVAKPINEKYPVSLLHWIIGDAKRSIVVEYTKNGMGIFDNDVDVLTNQPGFNWHKENLRNYMNVDSAQPEKVVWRKAEMRPFGSGSMMRGLPGDFSSTSRFVRVAYLNNHYPEKDTEEENVNRLFHTLSGVAMIDGGAAMANGEFEKTVYTGGYSAQTKTYYWNTYDDFGIKKACLDDFDLSGKDLITA